MGPVFLDFLMVPAAAGQFTVEASANRRIIFSHGKRRWRHFYFSDYTPTTIPDSGRTFFFLADPTKR
jgi:hypothetical protein